MSKSGCKLGEMAIMMIEDIGWVEGIGGVELQHLGRNRFVLQSLNKFLNLFHVPLMPLLD